MRYILFFICIASFGCKKTDTPNTQEQASISFNYDNETISYTGAINMDSLSGVGMWISGKTITPPLKTIYGIIGGSSYFNNIVMSFQILDTLGHGYVDFIGIPDVVYRIGDSNYIADEKTFTLNVSSYSNKLLNGTFSGVFKTALGSSINITNGKFINVPTRN